MAAAPHTSIAKSGTNASRTLKRTMHTNTNVTWTATSIVSIPTKPSAFQILSTSSFTRAISSPVLVLSKNEIDSVWICPNKSLRSCEPIFDASTSNKYSFIYPHTLRPIPTTTIPTSSLVSRSCRPSIITSSTMLFVMTG